MERADIDLLIQLEERFSGKLEELRYVKGEKKVALPVADGIEMVARRDILMCVANGKNTLVFLFRQAPLTCTLGLNKVEELLAGWPFFRSERSYLVNLRHVNKLRVTDGNTLYIGGSCKARVSKENVGTVKELLRHI